MMKFEDLLMQPSDENQKRILLEEEVEELREELDGQLQVKTVLQYALQRPNVGSCPCISTLPRRVQHLLEEVVMAEEEIAWLERKVDALKMKLYREKELAEKWEVLQLKQVQHQQHQRLISKPLPPPRPDRSQNYQLRKQYRIRKDRRASVGSSIDFHIIYSPINLNEEEIIESSSRGSRNWRRHHSQPVDLETNNETPNKLSEEVLKCLISIYLKLNKASLENQSSSTISTSIAKQSQTCSKKSKSNFICSKTCTSSAADAPIFALNDYASNLDPYGILLDTNGIQREIGSYKNFIQISTTSLNTCHISECLPQMGKLRSMVQKFSIVDITCLTYKQKLAFWINVYNICIMHAAINVGGIVLNALAIEHFILRHPRDIEHGLTDDNERFLRNAYGLEYPEPNVTFSLCRGSWSSPALRIYRPNEVTNELEKAKMAYLEASVGVTHKKKIMVPKLMQWHMKDFADDMESLVEWMYSQLPSSCSLKKSMMDCLVAGEKKSLSIAKMIELRIYRPDEVANELERAKMEYLEASVGVTKDNKATERRSKENSAINGEHIVEDDQNNSKKRKKVEQGSNQPKKKFKEKCFNYGKIGHKSTNCCTPKKDKKKDQANMLESNKECNDLCAMFSECNLMGNPREWWMDSGATCHVCSNKEFVSSFALAQVEKMIYMTNSSTAKVEGTGKICLKMTSGKVLTLNIVLYVLELRRNLISVSLLDKNGFKCVTVSRKIVISKGEMCVGKGYLTEGLYKMNLMNVEINKISSSSYLLESYDLWHERLGHVNYKKTLRKLINLDVLLNFECNKSKCQTCVESKYAKHPYKSVERNSNPLDLVHTDICDMKSTPSRAGKKYSITFIDDCTRYCYVYLLNSATRNEAARILSHSGNKIVIRATNEHLLLSSLQRNPGDPPSDNDGTNSLSTVMISQISQINFVGSKTTNVHHLLPSLQRNLVQPSAPSGITNSPSTDMTSQISERNFAGRKTTNEHFLLTPNGGTNTPSTDLTNHISEKKFAGRKTTEHLLFPRFQREPIPPPSPNQGSTGHH
ncbi:hypothetical protein CQW23_13638 [Capsicum baccatum]|uniref:DUF547 domain-containing protein n=1 Tax=Capsicum baccatum TaxID=33114 RepID=A0A2G2WH64_CAPBA|nr:hypothetical protein CQW23_13638 [Capsicum baccatum]